MKQIIEIEMDGQNLKGTAEHIHLLKLAAIEYKKTITEKPVITQTKRQNRSDNSNWSKKELKILKNAMQHSIFVNSGLSSQLKQIIQLDLSEHCKKHRSFNSITCKIYQLRHLKAKKIKRPIWTNQELDLAIELYLDRRSAKFIASTLYKRELSPVLRSNQSVLQKIYQHTNFRQNPDGLLQFRKGN